MPSEKILEQKKVVVSDLSEKIKTAVSGVFVDYCGLTVEEDTKLRTNLRNEGVDYSVVKNTLTRFAANGAGYTEFDEILNGPTSLALSFSDAVAPARVLIEFAKNNPNLEVKAGFVEGKVISVDEIKDLASIPSRDVLIAKMMGSMTSPISAFARTLNAIAEKLENGEELAPAAKEEAAPEAVTEASAEPAVEAPAAE